MNHPLLPLPQRTPESDVTYAVLGRALAYATEFEENCRTLAHIFHISSSDNDYALEIYMLSKKGTLNQKIQQFVKKYELPDWASEKVHQARKARNLIAHEIATNYAKQMENPDGRKSLETDILLAAQEIAEGNQLVLDVTRILIKHERGHGSDIVAYNTAVAEWVLP